MGKRHLIYGRHPVKEALEEGKEFEKIFIQKTARSPEIKEIIRLSRQGNVPTQLVPPQKLNAITGKNHQGVIGFLALVKYYSIEDVLPKVYEDGKTPLFLILDGVTDVRNFGAIARTALCMGVDALVIPQRGSAMINAEAIKASAGALNAIQVCREQHLAGAVNFLKLNGIQIFVADIKGEAKVNEIDFTMPLALVLGAEDKGVSNNIQKKADNRFVIPMSGEFDSLNVSVSAGVVLYEVMRQRDKL